ncbi:hypothetical protein BAOM_4687 [Peribacillus asahii]|uniref:Uncharacterized protein n=1 Tax=Peribacillus asahii TaxID=228899 RepID=A0A3Q9RMN7_9BACI|nr:putative motility protein [Peribacillus asahii]AZV45265.1 hypothetical protein BAOM_4687 [Peribacillus asahii]
MSVIKKAMDQAETSANGLIKMMDSVEVVAIQHAAWRKH